MKSLIKPSQSPKYSPKKTYSPSKMTKNSSVSSPRTSTVSSPRTSSVSLSKATYLCIKGNLGEDLQGKKEFVHALQNAGYNPTPDFISRYWNETTKSITFSEFQHILQTEPLPRKLDLLSYFRKFDLDGCGLIDKDIFLVAMTSKGQKLNKDLIEEYVNDAKFTRDQNMFDYVKFCANVFETSANLTNLAKERAAKLHEDFTVNSKTFKIKRKSPSPEKRRNWTQTKTKGAFYFEGEAIISHQFKFKVSKEGFFRLKIEPSASTKKQVDVQFYLFREEEKINGSPDEQKLCFIGRSDLVLGTNFVSSENLDYSVGVWEGMLNPGSFLVIPSTTGCKLKKRAHQPNVSIPLVTGKGQSMKLTKEFVEVLHEIYNQVDLDGSGSLSRSEFNLFNWRTSGEEVQDEEWTVVKENFAMVNKNELSVDGFVQLHQMEAEDNGGDSAELWITLNAMGYNASLIQDEASIYELTLSSEKEEKLNFEVSGLKSGGSVLDKATIKSIMDNSRRIKKVGGSGLEVNLFREDCGVCTSFVVQNRSSKNVNMKLDFSQSQNVLINHPHSMFNTSISPKSTLFIAHLIPKDYLQEYSVTLKDSLL